MPQRNFSPGSAWSMIGRGGLAYDGLVARQTRIRHGRLDAGGIEAILPDGAQRRIGFHSPGPVAVVHLHSWLSLVRLATSGSVGWYRAWEKGEWTSPDPVPLFDLFMRNAAPLGEVGRAKGSARWYNRLMHWRRDNDRRGATSPPITTSETISIPRGWTPA